MTDIVDATVASCLPDDLIRVILEFLFDMHKKHRKASKPKLLTLSKQVKSWLEPCLFRHLAISISPEYVACVSRALKEPRLAASIRTVFVPPRSTPSTSLLLDILRTSENISQLAVCDQVALGDNTDGNARIWQTEVPSLRRLSLIVIQQGAEILAPEFPIFQSLTHLCLLLTTRFRASPDEETGTLKSMLHPIRSLKNLTHLALDVQGPPQIDLIRSHLPSSAKIVVLQFDDGSHGTVSIDWILKACDPRLAFVLVDMSDNEKRRTGLYLDPHVREDFGLHDMWELAELTLERRREMQADAQRQGKGF